MQSSTQFSTQSSRGLQRIFLYLPFLSMHFCLSFQFTRCFLLNLHTSISVSIPCDHSHVFKPTLSAALLLSHAFLSTQLQLSRIFIDLHQTWLHVLIFPAQSLHTSHPFCLSAASQNSVAHPLISANLSVEPLLLLLPFELHAALRTCKNLQTKKKTRSPSVALTQSSSLGSPAVVRITYTYKNTEITCMGKILGLHVLIFLG